jgi:D-3-phosphoglycerate dehydrogenase
MGGSDELDRAISQADVISLHVPLDPETRLMLSRERLQSMRQDSIVINVSRAGLIDEDALADEIRSGHLLGAGLDVVVGEPASADNPLRRLPNVVITPHMAGNTDITYRRRGRFSAINISRVGRGLEPLSRIDALVSKG